jgi:hypothetical protein
MKCLVGAALLTATIANVAVALAQSSISPSVKDVSQNLQCWDTLHNVARDKNSGAGSVEATGQNAQMQSGSSSERKVQGPGAQPKDPTGVTVGESKAGQKLSQSGSSIRPAGLPNC